jgi:hypothetical protein
VSERDLVLRPASPEQTNALVAITGPAGSGKSYGALLLAHGLGEKIVVIDTELRPNRRRELRGRSETYQGAVALDGSGVKLGFSVITLGPPYTIPRYSEALETAWASGADVVIVDSLSHEWTGVLEHVDQLKRQYKNQMTAWQIASPEHSDFIGRLLAAPSHMICTIRSKMTTAEVEDEKGKKSFKRVGFQPIQRDGVEYEFELIFDVDYEHRAYVTKANAGYARTLDEFMAEPGHARLSVGLGRKLKGWLDAPGVGRPVVASKPPTLAASLGVTEGPFAPDVPEADAAPPVTAALDPANLTLDDVVTRIGLSRTGYAVEVLAASHHEPTAVAGAVLELAIRAHGKELVQKVWLDVGGQYDGEGRGRKRRPLTGLQLRALIARLPVLPAEAVKP